MVKNKGFTLIELIVVIVIIGILSVVVAPKYINFKGDAQKSVMMRMVETIKNANQMASSSALLQGISNSVCYGDTVDDPNVCRVVKGNPSFRITGVKSLTITSPDGYTYGMGVYAVDLPLVVSGLGDKTLVSSGVNGDFYVNVAKAIISISPKDDPKLADNWLLGPSLKKGGCYITYGSIYSTSSPPEASSSGIMAYDFTDC